MRGTQEYQLLFYYESMLGLIQRSIFSVFTQTDKMTYRPGETVKFRVVAVDYDLRPYNGHVDIIIMVSFYFQMTLFQVRLYRYVKINILTANINFLLAYVETVHFI